MEDDQEPEAATPFRFLGKEELLTLPPEERARYLQRAMEALRKGQGNPGDGDPSKTEE